MDGYNGYANYETWLLCLNIDNDYGLYSTIKEHLETVDAQRDKEGLIELSDYDLGQIIKDYLEELFWVPEYGIYKISDTWTDRDWKEIDWEEVASTRRDN